MMLRDIMVVGRWFKKAFEALASVLVLNLDMLFIPFLCQIGITPDASIYSQSRGRVRL